MILWIVRHAKTGDGDPDHGRTLTSRGRHDADALGRRLGHGGDRLGLPVTALPEVVLTSDATRVVQTAERVFPDHDLDRRKSLYYASPEQVLSEVDTVADGVTSIAVVGHNPTVHVLANELAGRELTSFPTCGVAVFEIGPEGEDECLGVFSPPY